MQDLIDQYMDNLKAVNDRIDELDALLKKNPNDSALIGRIKAMCNDRDGLVYAIGQMHNTGCNMEDKYKRIVDPSSYED